MAGCSISSLSTQYVQIPVRAWSGPGTLYNPTADSVQMAFVTSGTPSASDWNAASWASVSDVNGYYLAQCLVGPSGTASLAQGTYAAWIKVTDDPEVPVQAVGSVTVTP